MSILVNTGFKVGGAEPLNEYSVRETVDDRDDLVTNGYVYEGMKVYCKDTQLEYRYNGTDWETVGSSGGAVIDDTVTSTAKTHSSSKIHEDIQQCLDSSKAYTLSELGKLNGASYKVVASTSEMISKSIIYLLPNATNYDMYIVETDGTVTKIGNMDIDLSQYFTKQEITDNYYDKATSDSKFATVTTVDNHKDNTDIHITSDERTKWNDTADKVAGAELVKKADIKTTALDENATNDEIYGGKAIYDAIKANYVGKETVLFKGAINTTGTYTLADDVNIYDFIVINHCDEDNLKQSVVLTKNEINTCIDTNSSFTCVKAKGSTNLEINGYFNRNKIVISKCLRQNITSIVGYKFGQITVANTITNPAVGKSYSTDEQLTGGTWIDGKPIYRKTVNCGQLPNNDGKDIPHGIDNIDKVIYTYGIAFERGSISVSLPFADASSDGCISAYRNGAVIRITTAKDRTSFTESYVTLEYTKTTD